MSLVIESQVFAPVDVFKKAIQQKHIKIEQYESFQKMSFRNRYVIAGANGLNSLTIPIKGGREQRILIKEIEIDYTNDWMTKHCRSINSAYGSAPFFDFYYESVRDLIFSEEKLLLSLNSKILRWVLKTLRTNVEVSFTETYKPSYSLEEFNDCRNKYLPKDFQIDRKKWEPKYLQVFEHRVGFQPNLSILDLLFNEGPNALHLLQQCVK